MVPLPQMEASNDRIGAALPPNLVAVFTGSTGGIGEAALKEFVDKAQKPKCYMIGRSEQAANRIIAECEKLNPEATVIFISADLSLLKEANRVYELIKDKENAVNILFLSAGAAIMDRSKTSENIHALTALNVYSRLLLTQQMLPLLERATSLRRVVNIAAGAKEGHLFPDDWQALNMPLSSLRGHLGSLTTLSLEALAKRTPTVGFVHVFPGLVLTGLFDHIPGILGRFMRCWFWAIGPWMAVPIDESGKRNVFLSTSAAYPAREGDGANGVSLPDGVSVTRGSDGVNGSGVYSIDYDGTEGSKATLTLLDQYRKDGMIEKVWEHLQDTFKIIVEENN